MYKNNMVDNDSSNFMRIFVFVFIFIVGIFLLRFGVSILGVEDDNKSYVMIGIGLSFLSAPVVFLWSDIKFFNVSIIIGFISIVLFSFLSKDKLQQSYIQHEYLDINNFMIYSYSGIVDTPMYKEFLVYKNNNNISKMKEYRDNITNYTSIDQEKVMDLKLFYTSSNNKEIHSKLDEIFKDGLVTKPEYDDFQIFIYKISLNGNDQSLLTIIQK